MIKKKKKRIALTKRVNNGNEVKSRSLNTVSKIPKYVGNSNSSLSTKKNGNNNIKFLNLKIIYIYIYICIIIYV